MNQASSDHKGETFYQKARIPSGPFFQVNFVDTDPLGEKSETILINHGLLSSIESWEPVIKRLRQDYRVIGMDLRGHGRTENLDRPYSIEDLVGDVASFVYSRGITREDPIHIIGHSLGSAITLELITQEFIKPKTVTLFAGTTRFRGKVVFDLIRHTPMLLDQVKIAMTPHASEKRNDKELDLSFLAETKNQNENLFDEFTEGLEAYEVGDEEASEMSDSGVNMKLKHLVGYFKAKIKDQVPPVTINITPNSSFDVLYRIMRDFLWTWRVNENYLHRMDVPVHLITGDKDAVLPVTRARELKEKLVHAKLTVLPGATHIVTAENPDMLTRLITSFIEKHRGEA